MGTWRRTAAMTTLARMPQCSAGHLARVVRGSESTTAAAPVALVPAPPPVPLPTRPPAPTTTTPVAALSQTLTAPEPEPCSTASR